VIRALVALALTLLLGCAHPAVVPIFGTESSKSIACLDVRDHAVELYADDYLIEHHRTLPPRERDYFVIGWREELAKRGSLDRFVAFCEASLTSKRFYCAVASETPDALVACMQLSD
jgi:hypothetical protein